MNISKKYVNFRSLLFGLNKKKTTSWIQRLCL